jgi:protein involved in sex pheromone biosynthesis
MKKILMVAAAAGLMSLAACGGATNTVQENVIESHEANADNYEAAAENATSPAVENALLNAEASEENKAEAAETH